MTNSSTEMVKVTSQVYHRSKRPLIRGSYFCYRLPVDVVRNEDVTRRELDDLFDGAPAIIGVGVDAVEFRCQAVARLLGQRRDVKLQ